MFDGSPNKLVYFYKLYGYESKDNLNNGITNNNNKDVFGMWELRMRMNILFSF